MNPRQPDPRKLDVAAVAAHAQVIAGHWPLAGFSRLVEGAPQDGDVDWSVRGQRRVVPSGEPEVWLHIIARARLWRDCQRCLQPVALDLDVARALRFVRDEATAEALDAESEDDVLVMPHRLDLHELIEDELLLALPLVPLHAECPVRLPSSAGFEADENLDLTARKPFAGLAHLKRGGRP
jgi:uncharacterized protein